MSRVERKKQTNKQKKKKQKKKNSELSVESSFGAHARLLSNAKMSCSLAENILMAYRLH